jgi:hypothetical protein
MNTRIKRLFLGAVLVFGAVLVVGAAGVAWLAYSLRDSALEVTREWGRLDPLPPSARGLTITTHGSMFTREFRITFVAPAEEIHAWLASSPGTREAAVTAPAPGVRHFRIKPGGGAQFAEVVVDDNLHKVSIHAYWS